MRKLVLLFGLLIFFLFEAISNDNELIDCNRIFNDSLYFKKIEKRCENSVMREFKYPNSVARQVINCFEENNIELKPWQFKALGNYYFFIHKYGSSNKYYSEALSYSLQNNDSTSLPIIYLGLGLNYLYKIEQVKAFKYLQKSYDLSRFDTSVIIPALYFMSKCDRELSSQNKAIDIAELALNYCIENNDERYLAHIYSQIGYLHRLKLEFDVALEYNIKAEKIAKKRKDTFKLPHIHTHIGHLYNDLGDFGKAIYYLDLAYDKIKDRNEIPFLIVITSYYGNTYLKMKDYKNAEFYIKEYIRIAKILNQDRYLAAGYNGLRLLNIRQNKYKEAYYNFLKFNEHMEKNYKADEISVLAELQAKFDLDVKTKNAEIIANENQLNQLLLNKRKYLLISLCLGFILIIITFLILIKRNKLRNKQEEIEIKQQFFRFQMNPHFIFNTLNSIQYFIFRNNKKESSYYLEKFGQLMKMVLDNSKYEMVSVKDELDTLELYLELEKLRFDDKLEYEIDIDSKIDLLEYKIPPMLIQPFVENSILHGIIPKENNGKLKIGMKLVADKIICCIEDDGIGRERAMEIKTQTTNNKKSLGTKITESRLELIDTLYNKSLKIMYTDLKDELEKPIGTRVEISFPYK